MVVQPLIDPREEKRMKWSIVPHCPSSDTNSQKEERRGEDLPARDGDDGDAAGDANF